MHCIHRCTWKSLQFFIIIIMMATFMRVSQKLVFHQSTVNELAPSSVYSILPQCIYPHLLSCICVFLFTAMHVVWRFACGSEDVTHNTVAIGNPSGKCAKLHTVAASNSRDHVSQSLLSLLVRATWIYCCSSRTSLSW